MGVEKAGLLATAANCAIFVTICTVAYRQHVWNKLVQESVIVRTKKKKKLVVDERKKLVVISGCDRGFGRLLVEALTKHDDPENSNTNNYLVVALTLTKEAAEELKAIKILAIQCNVTSDNDVHAMKEYVETVVKKENGVLHTIVNNAGIANPGDFVWFHDLEIYKHVMDVNFFGQLRVAQALLPIMLRTSRVVGGRILNMSSVCGTTASPSNSAYSASKFAVEAWSDSLRLELEPFNVRVVKVRPGPYSTGIQEDWARNLLVNYAKAPDQIREFYGGDKFRDKLLSTFKSASSTAPPSKPSMVVDALINMINESDQTKLEPYYWIGRDAHTFWRALHSLPATVADVLKSSLHFRPLLPPTLPTESVVSHVTIRVRNLERSLPFYKAFGLETFGDTVDGQQFLRGPSTSKGNNNWSTLVLLKQDSSMPDRGKCSDIGMTRLCIYTTNLDAEVKRLSHIAGVELIAPVAHGSMGKLAAYHDPDNFVVYLIQFTGAIGLYLRATLLVNNKVHPCPFHWTVNVKDSKACNAVSAALGFKSVSDQNRDQVLYDLLPAFKMDPSTSVIEHIRLCKLPDSGFVVTIMEWVQPKSEPKGAERLNSLTLAVTDVEAALERARKAGMTTEPAEYRRLPVFGGVLVGTAYLEPGCNPIEFCCFTYKK